MDKTRDRIKNQFKLREIDFSSKLDIIDESDSVRLQLDYEYIKKNNMQETGNAFEGWAVACYICSSHKKIVLDVKNAKNIARDAYKRYAHWSRFLYRALKFAEQYEWFSCSDDLNERVLAFESYLKSDVVFSNNTPTKEAEGIRENITVEEANEVDFEYRLSKPNVLNTVLKKSKNTPDIGQGKVFRQLPVGLFDNTRNKAVFTSGHSAIDLWNRNGDVIDIVELKFRQHKIGIITEIFFYSNYIFDFINGNYQFTFRDEKENKFRGYNKLIEKEPTLVNVRGILLADEEFGFHPCVTKDVIDNLNENGKGGGIEYWLAKYNPAQIISGTII